MRLHQVGFERKGPSDRVRFHKGLGCAIAAPEREAEIEGLRQRLMFLGRDEHAKLVIAVLQDWALVSLLCRKVIEDISIMVLCFRRENLGHCFIAVPTLQS